MSEPERLKVIDIVKNYLAVSGFDGLYNQKKKCSCCMGQWDRCDELNADCQAGYLQPANTGIGPTLTLRCPYCRAVVGKDDAECLECGAVWD